MGTNYYLKGKPACEHCGRGSGRGLHIGKSSCGWTFGLRIYPLGTRDAIWREADLREIGVDEICSLEDWIPLFRKYGVVNEYGDDVTPDDMIACIAHRTGTMLRRDELARHLHVDFPFDKTYDLIVGEFS